MGDLVGEEKIDIPGYQDGFQYRLKKDQSASPGKPSVTPMKDPRLKLPSKPSPISLFVFIRL